MTRALEGGAHTVPLLTPPNRISVEFSANRLSAPQQVVINETMMRSDTYTLHICSTYDRRYYRQKSSRSVIPNQEVYTIKHGVVNGEEKSADALEHQGDG